MTEKPTADGRDAVDGWELRMSSTIWFLVIVLIAVVVMAGWSFYRRRRPKQGPMRSGNARMKYTTPPKHPSAELTQTLMGLALCASLITVWAPAAGANPDAADLSVSIAWIGKGSPRVHNGDTAMWTVTVTNQGPNDAQQPELAFFGGDQWNQVVSACGVSFCDLGTVAAGGSVNVTLSARACAFVTGESREASVTASVSSATPDPDETNNSRDFVTKIIGPHGELCA